MPLLWILIILIVSVLLIVALCILARAIAIERIVRSQFQLPKDNPIHHSIDRKFLPSFNVHGEISGEISQMYYFHDCIWRNVLVDLPGSLTKLIKYSKNSNKDPPIAVFIDVDNITYLIIRSTKTTPEKLKDIDVSQSCGSHKGIKSIYDSISSDLIEGIAKSDNVVIFGHSLGGAIVDILSYDLMTNHPELWQKCKTFSSAAPRVFAPSKSDDFSYNCKIGNYMKIINEADVVPFHPTTATTVNGLLSTGRKYFYKSFSNKERILRFNCVIETQALDSHLSSAYADSIWNIPHCEIPMMLNSIKC